MQASRLQLSGSKSKRASQKLRGAEEEPKRSRRRAEEEPKGSRRGAEEEPKKSRRGAEEQLKRRRRGAEGGGEEEEAKEEAESLGAVQLSSELA